MVLGPRVAFCAAIVTRTEFGLASKTQLDGCAPGPSLSGLKQRTFVAVDEAGTEAAAATAALVGLGLIQRPVPVTIRFDRPFIHVLRDHPTGAALMVGDVASPFAPVEGTEAVPDEVPKEPTH